MTATASKNKQTHYKNDNVLEALKSVPSSVGTTTVAEFSKIGGDIVSALIGGLPTSGELRPNQEIVLNAEKTEAVQPRYEAPRHDIHPRPDADRLEMETRQQLEVIRGELKSLVASLRGLHQEIETAVSQDIVDPGVYHLNFYEQLRTFIRVLHQQIEDSRVWLNAFSSRKKKLGYWGMFKKHGTTFGLSNERTLATSAG